MSNGQVLKALSIPDLLKGEIVEVQPGWDPHIHTHYSSQTRFGKEAVATAESLQTRHAELADKGLYVDLSHTTDHDIIPAGHSGVELSTRYGDILLHHENLYQIVQEMTNNKKLRKKKVDEITTPEIIDASKTGYDILEDRSGNLAFVWYFRINRNNPYEESGDDSKIAELLKKVAIGGTVILAHPFWNPNAYSEFRPDSSISSRVLAGLMAAGRGLVRLIGKLDEDTARQFDESLRTITIEPIPEYDNWTFRHLLEELEKSGVKINIGVEWNGSSPFYYNIGALMLPEYLNQRFHNIRFYSTAGTDDHASLWAGNVGLSENKKPENKKPYVIVDDSELENKSRKYEEKGKEAYEKLRSLDLPVPENPESNYFQLLGYLYMHTGRGEETAKAFGELISANGRHVLLKRAFAKYIMGPSAHLYYHVLNKRAVDSLKRSMNTYGQPGQSD